MLLPGRCAALAVLCWLGAAAAIPLPRGQVPLPRGTDVPMVEAVTLHEALCPDCVAEDWNFYGPKKDLASILNMTTLWFGNAQIKPGNKIFCQHGAVECEANAYLNCVQEHYPDKHDEYVHCFDWSLIFGCPGGCPAPAPQELYDTFT